LVQVPAIKKIARSSILHKSMDCEPKLGVPRKFRIVTEHPVNVTLDYLLINRNERDGKPGRDELIDYLGDMYGDLVAVLRSDGTSGEHLKPKDSWRN